MKWTEIPAGQLHAAEQRLRVAFGDKADLIVEKINEDSGLAKMIADYIIQSVCWSSAREIMGKNFFGPKEAIKHLGISPTDQQLAYFSEISFSETVLKELKDTHILVAVFPLSILEIRNRVNRDLFFSHEDSWYNNQDFAKEQGEAGWQLICKTAVDDSFSKNWQEQHALITKDEKMPTAQNMVYTIIGHYLAAGERLFENTYVRTASLASDGGRVRVGGFDSSGLAVRYYWDSDRHYDLGLVSSRKS